MHPIRPTLELSCGTVLATSSYAALPATDNTTSSSYYTCQLLFHSLQVFGQWTVTRWFGEYYQYYQYVLLLLLLGSSLVI